MIEPAQFEDVPRLVEIGRAMAQESPRWRRLIYSAEKVGNTITALLGTADGLVLVYRKQGQIVGGIMARVSSNWMSDDRIAQEIALFILPEHRASFAACRLISAMTAWAQIKGARWIEAGISTGVDTERTARLYERLGFERFQIGLECVNDGY